MSSYSAVVVAILKGEVFKSELLRPRTKNALNILTIGNGVLFGTLTTFWALAYIHKPIMQKIYRYASISVMPIAWVLILSSSIEFIQGDRQTDSICVWPFPTTTNHTNLVTRDSWNSTFQVITGNFTR